MLSVLLLPFSVLLMATAFRGYIPHINNQTARTKPTQDVTIRYAPSESPAYLEPKKSLPSS